MRGRSRSQPAEWAGLRLGHFQQGVGLVAGRQQRAAAPADDAMFVVDHPLPAEKATALGEAGMKQKQLHPHDQFFSSPSERTLPIDWPLSWAAVLSSNSRSRVTVGQAGSTSDATQPSTT